MALESFYGGKQGVSPVIKAKFKYINTEDPAYKARSGHTTKLTKEEARWLNDVFSNVNKKNIYKAWEANEEVNTTYIAAGDNTSEKLINAVKWTTELLKPFTMNECLKDVHYTDVWYGELCIIDTDNKLNPYNGMLFKRTLKQYDNRFAGTEYTLYAEYIGQIVGPSGGVPSFDFGSLDTEREKAIGIKPTYNTEVAPLTNTNWEYSYPTKDENNNTVLTTNIPDEIGDIAVLSAATPGGNEANIQMKPGKDTDGKYNDTIKYTWCNVRRKLDGKDDDAWIYLGFEIPYSWFDIDRTEIQYWDPRTNLVEHSQKGTDNKEHPFYHNLHFYIPRGARGIGPEEIFCINPKDPNTRNLPTGAELYAYDAISYNQEQDKYTVDQSKTKTVNSTDSYWVGKWCIYNPKISFSNRLNEDVFYIYLGSYKDIRAIQLDPDGTLTFTYSDNSKYSPAEKLTWIKSATALLDDTDDNNGTYGQFQLDIKFNNNINGKTPDISIDKNLHLIKGVTYTDSTGQIKFDYSDINNGTLSKTANGKIEYDKEITINTTSTSNDYGKVTIAKNTGGSRTEATLPLIKNAKYDETTGIITFTYSNIGNKEVGTLKYISKMKIDQSTGEILYKFNIDKEEADWHTLTDGANNFVLRDIVDAIISDGTKPASVHNLKDDGTLDTEEDTENPQKPIAGHLYIKYRGDSYYTDVGQVKTKPIISPILRLKNGLQEDGIPIYEFAGKDAVEGIINGSGYVDPQDSTTTVENNGTIQVAGDDATGGIIAATIGKENYLYYFDKAQGRWVNLGTLGSSGSGSSAKNLTIEKKSSLKGTENYSVSFKDDSRITFKDGTEDPEGSTTTDITDPITWPWEAKNN